MLKTIENLHLHEHLFNVCATSYGSITPVKSHVVLAMHNGKSQITIILAAWNLAQKYATYIDGWPLHEAVIK